MIGVNTTAMIEAAIVRRPVLSVRDEAFAHSQQQTLHFSYLSAAEGGFTIVSDNLADHVRELDLFSGEPDLGNADRFVARFVRPLGMATRATAHVCDAIERVAAARHPRQVPVDALAPEPSRTACRIPEHRMRILFVMRNHGYLRNYASTVRLLASRGHEVIVGSRGPERHMTVDTEGYLAALSREFPSVTVMELPKRNDGWKAFAGGVRSFRNALRYRHPALRGATSLVARAETHLANHTRIAPRHLPRSWALASVLSALARVVESAIPTDPRLDAVVSSIAPDVVVVTPLIDFVSYQVDYVKSAKRQGIPVAMAVASWDNLTNKGTINVQPDQVIVWNEAQKREAVSLHGVAPAAVRVTGAQLFDDWFERSPGTTREAFCARVGLDPARPFLLYLCSSLFIARDEVSFVRTLARTVAPFRVPDAA